MGFINKKMFFNLSSFFFFYFSIIGVFIIFLPKILEIYGYRSYEIGIIYAISPLIRFLIPFFFLKFLHFDQSLYKKALFVSILSAISFYFTIQNIYLFIISNFFLGISLGVILPYIESYSLEYLKKERYGKSRLYGSLGFMLIGVVLAKFLNIDFSYGIDFFVISVILMAFYGYKIVKMEEFKKNDDTSTNNKNFTLLSHKYLWISIILMQVSFAGFYNFFTIYEFTHGISYETISYLWAFGVICEIILFNYQTKFFRFSLLFLLKFSIFFTLIRWLMLFFFPSNLPILYLSQSLHAFSFALYHTVILSYLSKLYLNKKLVLQFYYGFGLGLGSFIGSLWAGFIYGDFLYLHSAFIAFIAFLFLFKR